MGKTLLLPPDRECEPLGRRRRHHAKKETTPYSRNSAIVSMEKPRKSPKLPPIEASSWAKVVSRRCVSVSMFSSWK